MGRLAAMATRPARLCAGLGETIAVVAVVRAMFLPRADAPFLTFTFAILVGVAMPLSIPWAVLFWGASRATKSSAVAIAECVLAGLIGTAQLALVVVLPTAVAESGGFVVVYVWALCSASAAVIVFLRLAARPMSARARM
jgi:hypothetical protein